MLIPTLTRVSTLVVSEDAVPFANWTRVGKTEHGLVTRACDTRDAGSWMGVQRDI
jgi:hypothetical protein